MGVAAHLAACSFHNVPSECRFRLALWEKDPQHALSFWLAAAHHSAWHCRKRGGNNVR